MTTELEVRDKIWGDVERIKEGNATDLFPGIMDVLSEYYVTKRECVVILNDDTIRRGFIERYNAREVDFRLTDDATISVLPTGNIVDIDKP